MAWIFARRVAALALIGFAPSPPAWAAAPFPVGADHGMVVSAQTLASQVGVDILRQGGNAVDAAVATGYALAVVYPAAGNLGGGGFMTIRLKDGRSTFLDFREKAPLAATRTMFLDAAGKLIPGASTATWLAVGVPGSVAGLEAARERYGTMSRTALIAPALALAREGFVLSDGDSAMIGVAAADLAKDPAAAAIFLKDGHIPAPGTKLVQADLAASLERISQDGPQAVYGGPIGKAIAAASTAGGGLIREADFDRYKVRELAPVQCTYRGITLISAPPPSSGGVTLCETLNILEGYDLTKMGFHSAAEAHVLADAMRLAYRDRNNALGDPAFVENPLEHLLDKAYAAKLRDLIPADAPAAVNGPAPPPEGRQTTHFSVVDAAGNAVSVTYTLNGWFGLRKIAGDTGILMNNEMDDFTAKPGSANMFGLVQGERNAVAPGKTPLSSMSPTILARDGQLLGVIGTPGGSRIITTVVNVIVDLVDHGMTLSEAIDAPRLHDQGLPDVIEAEPFALSADTRAVLQHEGYTIRDSQPWSLAEGILVGHPALGDERAAAHALSVPAPTEAHRYYGAADDRGQTGAAVGF